LFALTTMSVLGIATTKRMMLIGPWLLLALGASVGLMPRGLPRRLLVASLAFVAFVGWFGIVSRRYYAAPRWLEPWQEVAEQSAAVLRDGGAVIGNSGTFFFYMKWVFHIRDEHNDSAQFGLVPHSTPFPYLYMPSEWMIAHHPAQPTVLFIKGRQFGYPPAPTREAQLWLEGHCRLVDGQRMVYDSGSGWKQRFFPQLDQEPWRIQALRFACPAMTGE
jgi:hypothetical protein